MCYNTLPSRNNETRYSISSNTNKLMTKYDKFKAKYDKIPKHPSVFDPEPWLEYPWLIEEMLKVIKSQEETLERYCRDGIPNAIRMQYED